MNPPTVVAVLIVPALLAICVGWVLLKRAFTKPEFLPEEVALAAAWVFVVGSLLWLGVYLSGSTLLGFGAPWTWLTAAHFAFAGFGALTVTSLCCRVLSSRFALRILRILLFAHPVAYLVTAGGILGFRYCNQLGAASYELIFLTQLGAVVLGEPNRMAPGPCILLVLSLTVPVVTMVPALAWAWDHPILEMQGMIRYHGLANAIGHVGVAFAAFGWGRPRSHAANHDDVNPSP